MLGRDGICQGQTLGKDFFRHLGGGEEEGSGGLEGTVHASVVWGAGSLVTDPVMRVASDRWPLPLTSAFIVTP